MPDIKKQIDWQSVRQKMDSLARSSDDASALSNENVMKLLQAREQELSRPVVADKNEAVEFEAVVFALGDQRFAITVQHVLKVGRLGATANLPELPSPFAGIVNVHGKSVPLINTRTYLGVDSEGSSQSGFGVFLGYNLVELVLPVDRLDGFSLFSDEQISQPPEVDESDATPGLIAGITAEHVVLLDGDYILSDELLQLDTTA